jgi:hypothetical protein
MDIKLGLNCIAQSHPGRRFSRNASRRTQIRLGRDRLNNHVIPQRSLNTPHAVPRAAPVRRWPFFTRIPSEPATQPFDSFIARACAGSGFQLPRKS